MSSWRPEGWKNNTVPSTTYSDEVVGEHLASSDDGYEMYEAGADAMLEALKNLPAQSFISTSPVLKSGYYIFIPITT